MSEENKGRESEAEFPMPDLKVGDVVTVSAVVKEVLSDGIHVVLELPPVPIPGCDGYKQTIQVVKPVCQKD